MITNIVRKNMVRKTDVKHVDETLKELNTHGTFELPLDIYDDNCEIFHSIYTHWHEEMEIIYIEKGSGILRINTQTFRIQEGDFALINKEMVHSLKSDLKNILYFKSLVFDLNMLSGIAGDLCQEKLVHLLVNNQADFVHIIKTNDTRYESIHGIFLNIIESYQTREDFYYIKLKGLLFLLFYELAIGSYILPASQNDSKKLSSIKTVLYYIDSHYQEELSVTELASMVHYSEYYFMKVFKQYTGKTVISYINHLRLEKSKHLLFHSELSITEIALEVGFHNTSYFIRKFQEENGMTPQKLRKNCSIS